MAELAIEQPRSINSLPCWIKPKAQLVQHSVSHSGPPAVYGKLNSQAREGEAFWVWCLAPGGILSGVCPPAGATPHTCCLLLEGFFKKGRPSEAKNWNFWFSAFGRPSEGHEQLPQVSENLLRATTPFTSKKSRRGVGWPLEGCGNKGQYQGQD